MPRGRTQIILVAVCAAPAITGCAAKYKPQIAMLEQTNRQLTDRVNRLAGEVNDARQRENELSNALRAAREQEIALRERLNQVPQPETAPGWQPVPGGAVISIPGAVLFEPGRVTLRKESRKALDAIVSTLQGEYAERDIIVVGHTDNTPIQKSGWTDNWQLSTERSLAVVRYLRDRGVEPERIVVGGCGEHRPKAPNVGVAERAQNRRVTIMAADPELRFGRS